MKDCFQKNEKTKQDQKNDKNEQKDEKLFSAFFWTESLQIFLPFSDGVRILKRGHQLDDDDDGDVTPLQPILMTVSFF